jgi:hypothetical protein
MEFGFGVQRLYQGDELGVFELCLEVPSRLKVRTPALHRA